MDQDIFKNIAQEIDSILEKRSNVIINKSKDIDFKIMYKFFLDDVNNRVEANDLVKHMVEGYKNIVRKSDDFNTNIIAFTNLYNYLQRMNIVDKVDSNIINCVSEVFTKKDEQEYFFKLLDVLSNPTKENFLQLDNTKREVELTYLYLAAIYMQKILDYRSKQEETHTHNLPYCCTKIHIELKN